jgi:hypothetical protein
MGWCIYFKKVEVVTETLFAGSQVDESTLAAIYGRLLNGGGGDNTADQGKGDKG